jgi:hypothetical protein
MPVRPQLRELQFDRMDKMDRITATAFANFLSAAHRSANRYSHVQRFILPILSILSKLLFLFSLHKPEDQTARQDGRIGRIGRITATAVALGTALSG